ncbi:XkdQ/YqbQ family protein [Aneurinibacillus migulanus]|uniref:XkdQ/YqbQ family protein n=1 Tax=Aneurinibacillus migulanus TaxID=47500 RepID=UPI00209D65A7|nr:lysozyme family protein [Aneurinibacillus migulanus]MCP1354669.1 lysozyme family protein [Aneurinibacillus migulanus]
MALLHGQSNIKVAYIENGVTTYLEPLIETVIWSGDVMQAARRLDITLHVTIDGTKRIFKPKNGMEIRFFNDGFEYFRGVVFTYSIDHTGMMKITAYDEAIYLNKNTDTRIFRNMTASQIIKQICTEYGIASGTIVDTGYVIPKLIFREKTLYEMIIMALTETKKQTGKRFFMYTAIGKVNVVERKKQMVPYVIESGVNLISGSHTLSIEDLRNVINVFSGDGDKPSVSSAKNNESIKRFGLMKHVEYMDGDATKSQADQRAKELLSKMSRETATSTIEALGIGYAFAGRACYVKDVMIGFANSYYITNDTHTFEDGMHRMALGISLTDELPEIEYVAPKEKDTSNGWGSENGAEYSGGKATVNSNVRRYEELVRKYAAKYGIENMTELLLAKMMQESKGLGGDPMQSSESLGLPPNTIKDPEKSIEQGVKYFAQVLEKAKGDVKLALQSYNFGSGFIDYALARGGYSKEVAKQYSAMMAKKKGWSRYGDVNYVDHVLQYYTPESLGNGSKSTDAPNSTIAHVISIARTYIGKTKYVWGGGRTESQRNRNMFDCSSFVKHVFLRAGVDIGGPFSGVTTQTLVKEGREVPMKDIRVGDLVFAHTNRKYGHVLIYTGNGKVIGCGESGTKENSLAYWQSTYGIDAIRRIV